MKRLAIAAVAALSLSSLAQPAPAPAPAKGAPAPAPAPAPGKAAPAPAPAGSAAPAPAANAAPAPSPAATMDMSKMGPASRKPTNESTTKLEVNGYFKAQEEAMKSKNWEAALAGVDFPVTMITDSANGEPETTVMTREQYIATMKPMWEQMPADYKMTNKFTVSVLSDSLVNVVNDFTESYSKKTSKGRNQTLLVKSGGKWKSKVMTEAGWGGMAAPSPAPTAGTPPPAPAKTGTVAAPPPPAKTGTPAPAPAPAPGKSGAPAPAPAPAPKN